MKLSGGTIRKYQKEWEDLAGEDPMWTVLSWESKKNSWTEDEFFLEGDKAVDQLLRRLVHFSVPLKWDRALDFGCGVGRLTRPLTRSFTECWGVDISETMIKHARELVPGARFVVNSSSDLKLFPDNEFDLVCSLLVLQHLPSRHDMKAYICEFLRVLRPGGAAVFQAPSYIAPLHRIQPRRRVYGFLRSLGLAPALLLRMNLHPMRGTFLAPAEVSRIVESCGARILACDEGNHVPGAESRTYYVTK